MDTFDWNELQNAAGETPASEQTNSQPSEPVQAQSPVNEPQFDPNAYTYRWYAERPAAEAPVSRPVPEKKQKREKTHGFGKGVVALSLVCALLGGVVGAGGVLAMRNGSQTGTGAASPSGTATILVSSAERPTVETASVETGTLMTASQVYEKNVNSKVGTTTEMRGLREVSIGEDMAGAQVNKMGT